MLITTLIKVTRLV